MKILIPGSSGFIGTNFKLYSVHRNFRDIDLLKIKPEEVDFGGAETVLHLSALVHQMQGAPTEDYFRINTDLAFEMAKQAKAHGIRHFILMSTVKVYGEETTGNEPLTEDSPCHPVDPYGQSKLKAEEMIRTLEDENFIFSVIRSPLVHGPGVKGNMISLVKLAEKYPVIPLGNIHNLRTMVSVRNLIALIDRVIETRKGGVFIASDPEPVSTTRLIKEIAANFPRKKRILPVPGFMQSMVKIVLPAIHQRLFGSLVFDNGKTRRELDFEPPVSFEDGIREMVEWYKTTQI